jgi:HAD superfamily hydrolase (TIGR01509 family)
MKECVIFDLDGTLVETEQVWAEVRERFTEANGGRWREDAQQTMMGMRTEDWARYMQQELGVGLPQPEIAKLVVAAVAKRVSESVPVLPGADAALARLSNSFPLGLATSAARAVAGAVLERTGWHKFFAAVVSADEVARGKPAPDVYLLALQLLEAAPSRAVAVEDSTNGIRSAHAAGLRVIAIPNHAYPPDAQALGLASSVIRTLDALEVGSILEVL